MTGAADDPSVDDPADAPSVGPSVDDPSVDDPAARDPSADASGGGPPSDVWADWLLHRRDGDDPAVRDAIRPVLDVLRDRVLDGARLRPGDTVLDVGCGTGLVGFGALDRVGPAGGVVFTDVSAALVDGCRREAVARGVAGRCRFVRTALPDLPGVADGSVDVVTARSVLLYVEARAAALATLHRVLRPGGRLSVFEPVNRVGQDEPRDRLWGFDVTGHEDLADAVREVTASVSALLGGFDERDLFRWAEAAGFVAVDLEYRVGLDRAAPLPTRDLDAFLATAPNPLVPTYAETLSAALPDADRARLIERLRPQVAAGHHLRRQATALLTARRG